jgi:predicted cation transporter
VSKAVAGGLKLISDNLNIVIPLLGGLAVALAGIYSASILRGIASVATGIGSIITVLSGPVGLVAALAAAGLAFLSFGKDATKGVDDALARIQRMTEGSKRKQASLHNTMILTPRL